MQFVDQVNLQALAAKLKLVLIETPSNLLLRVVLASGTGAKIVTSHDDDCLIELTILLQQDFSLAHKEMELALKHAQIKPLAVGVAPRPAFVAAVLQPRRRR